MGEPQGPTDLSRTENNETPTKNTTNDNGEQKHTKQTSNSVTPSSDNLTQTPTNTSECQNMDEAAVSTEVCRFTGKVTPEQELSASVARKRRNANRKKLASGNRPRDATPVRDVVDISVTTTEDEASEEAPKTPERKLRKSKIARAESDNIKRRSTGDEFENETVKKDVSHNNINNLEDTSMEKSHEQKGGKTKHKTDPDHQEFCENNEQNNQKTEEGKKENTTKPSSAILGLLKRATGSIPKEKPPRRKKEKKNVKRSQSAPNEEYDKDELIQSFKIAQLMDFKKPQLANSSTESLISSSSSYEDDLVEKPFTPVVKQFIRRRKIEKAESAKEIKPKPQPTKKKWIQIKDVCQSWRDFKLEYKIEWNRIRSLRNRCLNDIGVLLIFCGLGGLMFKFTEGTFENFYKCGVKRVKRDFIDALWMKSHNLREDDWKSLARTKLRDFEEQLHSAHEAGVHSYSGQRSWSFLNGVVYAITIVTTIGYGHMYPTTNTGKALTIVYALIGIPLFLIILTDFGKLFTRAIKFLWAFVRRVYYTGTCKKARKTSAMQEVMKGAQLMYDTFRRPSHFFDENTHPHVQAAPKFSNSATSIPMTARSYKDGDTEPGTPALSAFEIDDEFNLPISVAIFLLVGYMFLGALIYIYWERWDFFSSFYFVFISMSTIGFGDFVPRHPLCMIISIIYLVFGLALMSMCINVVQVKLSDTFRQASNKLGATIGLAVTDEDGSILAVPPTIVEIPDIQRGEPKTDV